MIGTYNRCYSLAGKILRVISQTGVQRLKAAISWSSGRDDLARIGDELAGRFIIVILRKSRRGERDGANDSRQQSFREEW